MAPGARRRTKRALDLVGKLCAHPPCKLGRHIFDFRKLIDGAQRSSTERHARVLVFIVLAPISAHFEFAYQ